MGSLRSTLTALSFVYIVVWTVGLLWYRHYRRHSLARRYNLRPEDVRLRFGCATLSIFCCCFTLVSLCPIDDPTLEDLEKATRRRGNRRRLATAAQPSAITTPPKKVKMDRTPSATTAPPTVKMDRTVASPAKAPVAGRRSWKELSALALELAASRKSKAPARHAPVTRAVQLNPIYSQQPTRAGYVNPNQQRAATSTRRTSLESIRAAGRVRPAVQEKWTGLTDYQVCDVLARSLSEGRYFVNPAGMATQVFAEDCVFKDPSGVIVGLSGYLSTTGIRFDPQHSHVELLDIAVHSPRTITAVWTLGGYLGFPVDSRIYPVFEFVPPFQGWVTYGLNDTGLVVFQEQTWSVSATGPGMETTQMLGAYLPRMNAY